ncbi:MAG TPA: FAD-binding oxidoreductase [Gemmatimonadaceae bacterium]
MSSRGGAALEATRPVWDDGHRTPLPTLAGDVEADVCVIGLGGSGLSCIGELLSLGASVVGIDAGEVGGGAAGRNGGFFLAGLARFYHDTVAGIGRERARALYRLTLDEMDRIAAETPGAIARVGSLRIADSPEEELDCRRQLEAMRDDGFAVEWYEGAEGRGLLLPTDGTLQPLRRCRLLADGAVARGARLYEESRAVDVGRGEVRTDRGRVRAGAIVAAVDGAIERLFPELDGRARTARLQMLATAPVQARVVRRPVYARWGLEYWQQLPDGRIAIGGFRDLGGEGEWGADPVPSAPVQAALERIVRERLGVRAPVTHRWAAQVAYTPDGIPVFDEVRRGVWAIGAYSGTGNVVGAMYGRAAAQLVVAGRSRLADALRGD